MPLVARLPTFDTIRRFRAAATKRYREGCALAACEERLGALYLLGYSAEMLIKAAYFRHIGKGPDDPIRDGDRGSAHIRAKQFGVSPKRNFHDIRWWLDLLIQSRRSSPRPYEVQLASQLTKHGRIVDENWRETLRYRTNRPRERELAGVTESVQWLLRHYRVL